MRKIRVNSVIFICAVFLHTHVSGQEIKKFVQTNKGVEIEIRNSYTGIRKIRLEPLNDQIIHVTQVTGADFKIRPSLMAIWDQQTKHPFSVREENDEVSLSTAAVKVTVSAENGQITFHDANGHLLLQQSKQVAPAMVPKVFNGESSYQISQLFNAADQEAYYGLGQHQQAVMNYRGRRVDLVQYNTDIAVPFMVSNKGYGLLWDNYSITRAGDIRDYEPLSALKLSNGKQEGWITATYTSRKNPGKVLMTAPVSEISINWLTDQHKWPKNVDMSDAVVTYEGAVESDLAGLYQLQLKYAGYIKVWFDDQLVADYWRQAWNSGSATLDLELKEKKKVKFKMEWIPDGSESYLGLTCLTPVPEQLKNTFGIQSESGDAVDYYFIQGRNADQVISGYRQITGKAVLMPKWAMGFWQSRERYKTQDDISSTVKEFRERKIPLDNIVLDWSYWKEPEWGSQEFDPARFKAPDQMIKDLHAQNVQLMISVWPKFNSGHDAYEQLDKQDFLYRRNIADGRKDWIGQGYKNTFYDAFNPAARTAFWKLMNKRLYSKGIDAWWMDATEPDMHSNLPVENRKDLMNPNHAGSSTTYFNAFPLVNASGVYEGQRSVKPNERVFILTRSAYAGLQRYAAAAWSGDIASRWEDMKAQISAGVNFSLSGMPYWTMDIGGFSVEKRYEEPNAADQEEWRELNTRWFQFGAFVPLFRSHGQYPFREIYNIAPDTHPAYQSMLYYNKLRYKLMPYIYTLAGQSYQKDYTIMRGLMMDFPNDQKAANLNDQFMFGPSILVSPVLKYKATSRELYLPQGQGWYDFYTGKFLKGGQDIQADAPYDRMPLYVKAGSIIPTGPDMQYTSEKKSDPTTILVYTGQDASFTLYEDEGTNYNYEKGAFSQIEFTYQEASGTLTIANRQGEFKGMLPTRTFKVVFVSPDAPAAADAATAHNAIKIQYKGQKAILKKNQIK